VQRNSNLVVALEQYTIRTIHNADAVLQFMKTEMEKNEGRLDFNELMNIPSIDKELFNGVAILDTSGRIISANFPVRYDALLNFRDRQYFQFHQKKANDELYISKPLESKTIGRTVITLSRRINRPDGRFGGVVVLQIVPSTFTLFYSGAELRKLDIISLISPDGITYARLSGNVPSYGENISKSPLFGHVAKNPIGSYFAKDAIRGVETYFSYRKLQKYPIIATVGAARNDVLANYQLKARRDYITTTFISLLIILFTVLVVLGIFYRSRHIKLLKESEGRYRSMFENCKDAIVILQPDGSIISMNPAANNIFRIGAGMHPQLDFTSFLKANPANNAIHADVQVPPEGFDDEIVFNRQDGTAFMGEMASASYTDARGNRVIIAIIRDTTEKIQLQKKLIDEKKYRQELITKQVILAQEREREAIGRELHDNVNQVLTTVKLYLELATKDENMASQILPKCMNLINGSINEIRNLSHELSAPTLGTRSLLDSIAALLETVSASSGLKVHFCHKRYTHHIEMEEKLALYRIVQEQLNNILKHADATEVMITLGQDGEHTILTVTDNGKGFDPENSRKGIGLSNIEGRVKVFQGRFSLQSSPGNGCTLRVYFPLKSSSITQQ